MKTRKHIAVYPWVSDRKTDRLLSCLAAAFEVQFSPLHSLDAYAHDALILLADEDARWLRELERIPAVFSVPPPQPAASPSDAVVSFSADANVPPAFRGLVLNARLPAPSATPDLPAFHSVAGCDRGSLWSVARGAFHYRSNLPLAGLADDEEVVDVLQEMEFPWILPLVDFLNQLTRSSGWIRAESRATLILDDPNLHALRYGHVDYVQLARRAELIGFHACMATIPLDGWLISRRVADHFRSNPKTLSLATHGNDHEYKELGRPRSAREAEQLIAHALRRISRVERQHGINVGRVMVPPHGICNGTFLDVLARSGWYGATTTRTSVWRNVAHAERPLGSGIAPAEIVHGLPIVHRFRFRSDRWQHRVAMAAYLGQPLIAYGHHEDFAEGINAFDTVATRINQLGARWCSPADVFSGNYTCASANNRTMIRPYSRHLRLNLKAGVSQVTFDTAHFRSGGARSINIVDLVSGRRTELAPGAPLLLPPERAAALAVDVVPENAITFESIPHRRTSVTCAIRRVGTELRDRCSQLRA